MEKIGHLHCGIFLDFLNHLYYLVNVTLLIFEFTLFLIVKVLSRNDVENFLLDLFIEFWFNFFKLSVIWHTWSGELLCKGVIPVESSHYFVDGLSIHLFCIFENYPANSWFWSFIEKYLVDTKSYRLCIFFPDVFGKLVLIVRS